MESINFQNRYFQHFKGGYYRLLHIASHSETLEPYVVYQALYGEKSIWIRPEKMFFEDIILDNQKVPRFRELNQSELESFLKRDETI